MMVAQRWYSKRGLDCELLVPESPTDAPALPIPHSWSASGREGVDFNMNMALDPVISFQEFAEMLEDFHIIPQLVRKSLVKRAFRKVLCGKKAYQTRRQEIQQCAAFMKIRPY